MKNRIKIVFFSFEETLQVINPTRQFKNYKFIF